MKITLKNLNYFLAPFWHFNQRFSLEVVSKFLETPIYKVFSILSFLNLDQNFSKIWSKVVILYCYQL